MRIRPVDLHDRAFERDRLAGVELRGERMMRVEHRRGKPRERDEERESPESCHGGRASKTKAIGDERLKESKSRLRDASTNNPVDPAHAMRTELFVT